MRKKSWIEENHITYLTEVPCNKKPKSPSIERGAFAFHQPAILSALSLINKISDEIKLISPKSLFRGTVSGEGGILHKFSVLSSIKGFFMSDSRKCPDGLEGLEVFLRKSDRRMVPKDINWVKNNRHIKFP